MIKVVIEDKVKEFIIFYFFKFMREFEEIKNKNIKKFRIIMFWLGFLGVKYNYMIKVKGNLVYDLLFKKLRLNY